MHTSFWFAPGSALIALAFAFVFYLRMKNESEGNETMVRIASYVTDGAHAYLRQQYRVVAFVFVVIFLLLLYLALGLGVLEPLAPLAFLSGGIVSGLAGYFGMKTATRLRQPHRSSGQRIARPRTAGGLSKWSGHGTFRGWTRPAGDFLLVFLAQVACTPSKAKRPARTYC